MGDVGRPPLAATVQDVVSRLRFAASMGESLAKREFEGSWSGYGHELAALCVSGGTGKVGVLVVAAPTAAALPAMSTAVPVTQASQRLAALRGVIVCRMPGAVSHARQRKWTASPAR